MGNTLTKRIAVVAVSAATVIALSGVLPLAARAATFSRDLTVGSKGDDVTALQQFLIDGGYLKIAQPTGYFGRLTKAAVAAWQKASGVSPAAGYFGPRSRAAYVAMAGGSGSGPTSGSTVGLPAGLTLESVSVVASILPNDVLRAETTLFKATAVGGDVTINTVTVQRTGFAANATIVGVALIDKSTGLQLGLARPVGSDDRAIIGEPVTLKAGESRVFAIAVNRAAVAAGGAGQLLSMDVVAVSASATVNGSLPLRGVQHTINTTLLTGTVAVARGAADPGAASIQEIGKAFNFSGVALTAGAAEDLLFKSIRWNQTGSASKGDLANVKTYVNGIAYDAVISSDGKYYSTVFPGDGVRIAKGSVAQVYVGGQILSGALRTVSFDLDRRDIYLVGATFGFGITPPLPGGADPGANTSLFRPLDNPYWDNVITNIGAGTTNSSLWSGVPATTIPVNVPGVDILGLTIVVTGEPVTLDLPVNAGVTGAGRTLAANLDSVQLVNAATGAIVGGPLTPTLAAANGALVNFTGIRLPRGVNNLKLQAKLVNVVGSAWVTGNTVVASSSPAVAIGDITGTNIVLAAVNGLAQNVRVGSLSLSISTQPTGRALVGGVPAFEFSRLILDASNSGENIRLTSIPMAYQGFLAGALATSLRNCQVYDGVAANAVSLTTGSNVLNPTIFSSSTVFTFDGNGVVVEKGTGRTLSFRCDVVTGAAGTYYIGLESDNAPLFTGASGLTSGDIIAEVMNDAVGPLMAVAGAGVYTITNEPSVLYKAAQAGNSEVLLAQFNVNNTGAEDLWKKQFAFEMGNLASSTPADLAGQKASLWLGNTKLADIQFGLGAAGAQRSATTTLSANGVLIPRNATVQFSVRGTLSVQNADEGTPGNFIQIMVDGANNGLGGNYALGVSSGATIGANGGVAFADVGSNGVRAFRAFASFEDVTTQTALVAGSDLYAVKVTANAGRDLGLRRLSFQIATTGAAGFSVTGFQVFGPSGAVNAAGVFAIDKYVAGADVDAVEIGFDAGNPDRLVPAGTSKIYRLRANTIAGLTANNVETLNVALRGDVAYPALAGLMGTFAAVDADPLNDGVVLNVFSIVTPTTAAVDGNVDFTNGFGWPFIGKGIGLLGPGQNLTTGSFRD